MEVKINFLEYLPGCKNTCVDLISYSCPEHQCRRDTQEGLCPSPGSVGILWHFLCPIAQPSWVAVVLLTSLRPTESDLLQNLLAASCVYILIRCQVFIPIPLDFIPFPLLFCWWQEQFSTLPVLLGHSGEWGGELGGKMSCTGRLGRWSPWSWPWEAIFPPPSLLRRRMDCGWVLKCCGSRVPSLWKVSSLPL